MPPKCPREGEGEGENSSVKARLSLPRDTRGTAGTFAGSQGRRAASKRRKVSSRVGDKYRFQLDSIAIEGKQTLARGPGDGLSQRSPFFRPPAVLEPTFSINYYDALLYINISTLKNPPRKPTFSTLIGSYVYISLRILFVIVLKGSREKDADTIAFDRVCHAHL